MTEDMLIKAVQAHFDNYTNEFKTRIRDMVPAAIAEFAAATQWEFLDRLVENCTVQVSIVAAVGKYQVVTPADFFKPVVLYTTNGPLDYISRDVWARRQASTSTYDGTAIHMVYTRKTDNVSLNDIAPQYHPAVQLAVEKKLAPAYIVFNNHMTPSPGQANAQRAYKEAVLAAFNIEASQKARYKRLVPGDTQRGTVRQREYTIIGNEIILA